MRMICLLTTALFFSIQCLGQVRADYVLTINRTTTEDVGQNALVKFDVLLTLAPNTPDQNLNGFSLFMDIANPEGKGLPVGIGGVAISNYLAGFTSSNGAGVDSGLANSFSTSNFDFSVNAENTGGTVISQASTRRLFELTINTGTLQGGSYSLIFRDDPIGDGQSIRDVFPSFVSGDFGDPSQSSILSSSFVIVTAVPEPSSLALVGVCVLMGCIRRRRRRD